MDEEAPAMVLGFPSYREPALRLAEKAKLAYDDISVHLFPDQESLVRLPASLPRHVVLCCSLNDPNRKLIELELAAVTALELGARRLTLVAPYLGYMRQDTAFRPGEAVSQRIIGRRLASLFDTVISVDPHLHRTKSLGEAVPARQAIALNAATLITQWLLENVERPLLLGPDEESEQWVRSVAEPAGFDYAVARKQRSGDRDVAIELPSIDLTGRHVVLVDDVVSTGQTLIEVATKTADKATSLSAVITHALFVDDALEKLLNAGVTTVCSTDSVLHSSNQLRLDSTLADALKAN